MSDSMSVDRRWWHDLGVAEDIDHLQDPEIAAVRRQPFEDAVCPDCGAEDLTAQGDLPRAACGSCGAVSGPDELTGAPSCVDELGVQPGSDTAQLVEKLERVTGRSIDEWLEHFEATETIQVWHVPLEQAEAHYLPLHDPELGTIMVGYPRHETGDSVKFNRAVYILSLHTTERHPSLGPGHNWQERWFTDIESWEAKVQWCVGVENRSFRWDWDHLMDSHAYWPFSEMHRVM